MILIEYEAISLVEPGLNTRAMINYFDRINYKIDQIIMQRNRNYRNCDRNLYVCDNENDRTKAEFLHLI